VGSLVNRSAGIALLAGLFTWLAVSFFADRRDAIRRLKTFLAILILGIAVQAAWMQWAAKHEVLQWPMVEGWPKSYFAQLKVKDGRYPELGMATLSDILSRVEQNVDDEAVLLAKFLTRKEYVNPAWFSPLVFGPVLVILLGVVSSILQGGGNWAEWYFIAYEVMYLLWPWNFDQRFFLPVAPLACLYLWRGGKALVKIACERARAVGALSFPLSVSFAMYARAGGWRSGSAVFWVLATIVSGWMAWAGSYKPPAIFASFLARLGTLVSAGGKSLAVPRIVGAVTVAALLVVGLVQELAAGRENLSFDMATNSNYADVLAGKWVQANTANTAVVMARQFDVVYHYSRRNVIWFPPSSDPQLLMEGIRKYKVEFIIVSDRRIYSYLQPPESVGFESLLRVYPSAFRLVHEEPQFKVFTVVPKSSKTDKSIQPSKANFFPRDRSS
jgi:hypothetical protein